MGQKRKPGSFDAKAFWAKGGFTGSVHGTSGGSNSSSSDRPRSGGECEDCGGTGDCVHCFQGIYYRKDGSSALCGRCHGNTRRGRYPCHACKGSGYGGRKCNTPRYSEENASKAFGTGNTGKYGDRNFTDPVHGTTADGQNVTASFGRDGTSSAGHSLLRDGHAEGAEDFYGPKGSKNHDHYDGKGGGTQRGKHS